MTRRQLVVTELPLTGVQLIEASAGTGKTYTITSLVIRLLVEAELSIEQIVAVTFTNAATAELKERIGRRITEVTRAVRLAADCRAAAGDAVTRDAVTGDAGAGDAADTHPDALIAHVLALPNRREVLLRLEQAERDADRSSVFTIHGFAARMLTSHAFESGAREDRELSGDDRGLLYDVAADFWSSRISTLEDSQFKLIGGTSVFKRLLEVAKTVSGAFEIPIAPPQPAPDLGEAEAAFDALYRRARVEFEQDGDALFAMALGWRGLNQNTHPGEKLAADAGEFRDFFAPATQSPLNYPKDLRRWTASRFLKASQGKKCQGVLSHPLLDTLEALADASEAVKAAGAGLLSQLIHAFAGEVSRRSELERERLSVRSFDGLLSELCLALRKPEAGERLAQSIAARFPVALIDEFQDTDAVQYEIFRRVYAPAAFHGASEVTERGLFLIGDPKQSIYAFRGADVATYLAAARDAAFIWTLQTSYRASPQVVAAQNTLFGRASDPFQSEGIAYERITTPEGKGNQLKQASGELLPGLRVIDAEEHPDALRLAAEEIVRLLTSGAQIADAPISPRHIAALLRTNRQAEALQAHLIKLGIPAVLHGDRSVFESDEATELRRILMALAEPNQRRLVRTALATRLIGVSADQLAKMDEEPEALELWATRFRETAALFRQKGVAHALSALATEVDLVPRNLADADGERRVTNFRHLLELLHEAEGTEHLGVVGLLRYLDTAIFAPIGHAMAPEARQVRLESDDDAVTLTTAHKSKGLEYDVVVLPALGDSHFAVGQVYRFHESGEGWIAVEKDVETHQIADGESFEEALRLAYVALTRAKHQVVVISGAPKSPSALTYLLHGGHPRSPESPLGGGAAGYKVWKECFKNKPVSEREAELSALASASGGAIEVSVGERDAPAAAYQRATLLGELCEPDEPALPAIGSRTSSFSSMTRGASVGHLSRAAREGRDRDELEQADEGASGRRQRMFDRVVLADFPRGARPGDALHALFEYSPFHEGTPGERLTVIEEQLKKRGFDLNLVPVAAAAVEDVLSTPLGARGHRLGQLSAQSRAPEMEFSLPVGAPARAVLGGSSSAARLSAARLAAALRGEGQLGSDEYLAQVEELEFNAWSGFLRGFMDLVFEADGRLYVLDYKSNFLGETYGDYSQGAMHEVMESHHYLLQGLLYAVAVHRYGASRIPNYSFETHFGGAYYLFLRGVRPEQAAGQEQNGVYFFRPERALIERLDRALGGHS